MRATAMALAAVAMLATTACTPAMGPTAMNQPTPRPAKAVQVKVTVRNNKDDAVNVYALVNGTYKHIMTVPAMETFNTNVQANTAVGLRLLVDPVGSNNAFFTNRILVGPGQGIDITVATSLQQSSWAVD
jgi:NH3-dependent NAD+ synthetase